MSDLSEKLRLAPAETPEELAHRYVRETRPALVQLEADLNQAIGDFRVGSVHHLNAVPLTRGIEDHVLFIPPSELAKKLRAGELDAALLSITEALFDDSYDVLDGIGICALGEVKSVFLAHRQPLEAMREIYCDTASVASVNLLKVLLAENGLSPELKPLPSYAAAHQVDNVFLIGNHALEFIITPHEHAIWDFGAAWMELTQLPFVFAAWTLRRDRDTTALRQILRGSKTFGLDTLDTIIADQPEFTHELRQDYLGWHIHYHLGSDERRGIAKFVELLNKHGIGHAHAPHFVA